MMKALSQDVSKLADLSEELRQRGRFKEALEIIKNSLERNPGHPRGRLLLARLLYQEGKILQALEDLRSLDSILSGDDGLKAIHSGLERLWQMKRSAPASTFVTETMARLLAKQGYFLEAAEIYRQLYLASGGEKRHWQEILLLRDRVRQEGSREMQEEKMAQELEALDWWIQQQEREL